MHRFLLTIEVDGTDADAREIRDELAAQAMERSDVMAVAAAPPVAVSTTKTTEGQ